MSAPTDRGSFVRNVTPNAILLHQLSWDSLLGSPSHLARNPAYIPCSNLKNPEKKPFRPSTFCFMRKSPPKTEKLCCRTASGVHVLSRMRAAAASGSNDVAPSAASSTRTWSATCTLDARHRHS